MSKKESKNIYQRINDVMADVSYVNKEERKVNGQYTFVSHDAVTAAIHPHLVSHGITVVTNCSELEQDGNRTKVWVNFKFVNIDDPKDFIEVQFPGYGIDSQDKGVGKAISYAVKYCLLKMFCLETGDDVEKDMVDHKPQPISDEQYLTLEALVADNDEFKNQLMSFLRKHHKCESLADMPVKLYDKVLQRARKAREDVKDGQ